MNIGHFHFGRNFGQPFESKSSPSRCQWEKCLLHSEHFFFALSFEHLLLFRRNWHFQWQRNEIQSTFEIGLWMTLAKNGCARTIDFLSENHFTCILIFGVTFVSFDLSTPSLVITQLLYNDFFSHLKFQCQFWKITFVFRFKRCLENFNKNIRSQTLDVFHLRKIIILWMIIHWMGRKITHSYTIEVAMNVGMKFNSRR